MWDDDHQPTTQKGRRKEGSNSRKRERGTGTRVCETVTTRIPDAPRGSTISQGSLYRCSATKQRTELRTSHRRFNKTSELGLESDDGWASERGALAALPVLASACLLVFPFLARQFRPASTSERSLQGDTGRLHAARRVIGHCCCSDYR